MTAMRSFVLAVGLVLLGGAGTGCGIKEYLNCQALCQKKKDCVATNYDVNACTNSCSNSADNDANYARQVDTCKECVSPLACSDYKIASCLVNCPALP